MLETAFFPHLWRQKDVFQRSLHNFIPFFLPLCPGGPKANLRKPRVTQGWGCFYNLLLSPWAQGSKDQPKSMTGLLLTSLGVAYCPSSRSRSYCLVGPLKLGTSCNWSNAGLTGPHSTGYWHPRIHSALLAPANKKHLLMRPKTSLQWSPYIFTWLRFAAVIGAIFWPISFINALWEALSFESTADSFFLSILAGCSGICVPVILEMLVYLAE